MFLLIKHPEFDYDNLGNNRWNQLFRGARYMQSTTLKDIITQNPPKNPNKLFIKLLNNKHTRAAEALARFHPKIDLTAREELGQRANEAEPLPPTLFDRAIDYAREIQNSEDKQAYGSAYAQNPGRFIRNILKTDKKLLGKTGNYPTKLHQLIANQHPNRAQFLAKHLAPDTPHFNTQDNNGNTPLHLAIEKNQKEVLRAIISSPKIKYGIQNNKGLTPLHQTVYSEKYATLEQKPHTLDPTCMFAQLANKTRPLKQSAWKKTQTEGNTVAHLLIHKMSDKKQRNQDANLETEEVALSVLLETSKRVMNLPNELKQKGIFSIFSKDPTFKTALLLQKDENGRTPYALASQKKLPQNIVKKLKP